ncbi:PREDICTED: Niemann-Pick C1 protein-like [Dinoponera quadriceps]|uniref:Niemann-Pick C1 protein-like n=1 Tax=Dinoponera quadriceps TaxID=609295 RepID=A0A6P3XMZ8_DINQU|nr:PREDICTED: Niemann-Pick C1 protein-like [Dinoponera quadriceps]
MSNCKETMELKEDHGRKQSYYRFWRSIPERISRGIEHFFYLLGTKIARNPLKWMLGCSVIILICILGLFRFRQEKNPIKLWNPSDAEFVLDTEWLMSHYEEALRIQTFILSGNNVLEPQTLIKLNEITKEMISVQTTEKIFWTDVCMKVPTISTYATNRQKRQNSFFEDIFFDDDLFSKLNDSTFEPVIHFNTELYCDVLNNLPKSCLIFSILDIWDFDSAKIAEDTTDEIIEKINTVKVSPTLGHPMNFSELLGGITLDERGRIVAATAIKTDMMVHVNFLDVDMDKIGNTAGTADWATEDVLNWESAYLEAAKNISDKLQHERNENTSLVFYYEAGRSFGDISGTSMFQDMDKLAIGTMLMFLYVLTILSKSNWVEWRFYLTTIGLMCVGSAFILAVSLCSLFGVPYGPVHASLPFLLLGLGIDDIFVFMASWKQIHTDKSILDKPLTEKVGITLGHAGSAITVTSFTDIVAFLIGACTILPSLQSFCIYAAVGVLVTYLLQITFFVGCFTLDTKRIEKKRSGALPCIVHEKFTSELIDPSSTISWRFINVLYSRVIFTTIGKVAIVLITITMMSAGVVGTVQLEQWFDPLWLLPKESYLNQYSLIVKQNFPGHGLNSFVVMGDGVDFPSEMPKIISLTERLENASFVQTVEPWPIDFARFVSTYYKTDLKTTTITDSEFHNYLSKFLVSRAGGKYQRNFFFNDTFTCGRNTPHITIASIDFKFKTFKGPHEWIPAMDDSRHIAKEAQIHGFVTVWCKFFGPWTSDKLISQEVIRNVLLALVCVIGTTAIVIAELQTCWWILLCVLLTLLDVCGFMYFWGLTIDIISCIGLELGIGLSVDYAAHVAHAFLNTESHQDDRNARTTRALNAIKYIGAAVAYGAGSTLLAISMLAFSSSYVFVSFFKIFLLVVLFGLWHGLIFLPVVLSVIGPRSLRSTQRQPMSEKAAIADDEN